MRKGVKTNLKKHPAKILCSDESLDQTLSSVLTTHILKPLFQKIIKQLKIFYVYKMNI